MLFIEKIRIIQGAMIFFSVSVFLFCSNDKLTNDNTLPVHKAAVKAVITDSATSAPIQNAAVVIYNSVTNAEASNAATDSLGACLLVVNADTSYYLKVSAAGYLSYNGTATPFQVVENDTVEEPVELVKIVSPATVKVIVADNGTNDPIENANVIIFKASNSDTVSSASTDTSGICYFVVTGDSVYYVRVSAAGYHPYPLPNVSPPHFLVKQADTTVRSIKLTKITNPAVVKVITTDGCVCSHWVLDRLC